MRPTQAEALIRDGVRVVTLVTITGPAHVFRVASEPIHVPATDEDGPYQYHPGLISTPSLVSEVDVFRGEGFATLRAAQVRVILPGVNPASLEQDWYQLTASRLEIATIYPGQDWRDRVVVLDGGQVQRVSLGLEGEPSTFVAEASAPPAGDYGVEADRDMGTDYPVGGGYTSLDGLPFPLIVGRCYAVPLFKIGEDPAGTFNALCMGEHLADDVTLASIIIVRSDGSAVTAASVENAQTSDDGDVSFITDTGAGAEFDGADDYSYTADFTSGGVAAARSGDHAAVGAGEVIEYLLTRSGVRVDWDANAAAMQLVSDWEIGVYLDRVDDVLGTLRSRVIPFLPLVERSGAKGMWYQFCDPWRAPEEFNVTLGQELLGRVGNMESTDTDRIRNVFSLEYDYDHMTGLYRKRLTMGAAETSTTGTARSVRHPACDYSQAWWGKRAADSMQCNVTWDDSTAEMMLLWQITRQALPRQKLTYLLDPSMYWLREGMLGRLTDPDRGIVAAPCALRVWRPAGSPWQATFETCARIPAASL